MSHYCCDTGEHKVSVTNWGRILPLTHLRWPLSLKSPCFSSSHEASEKLFWSWAAPTFRAAYPPLLPSFAHHFIIQLIAQHVIWSHNCTQSNWKYPVYPKFSCFTQQYITQANRSWRQKEEMTELPGPGGTKHKCQLWSRQKTPALHGSRQHSEWQTCINHMLPGNSKCGSSNSPSSTGIAPL